MPWLDRKLGRASPGVKTLVLYRSPYSGDSNLDGEFNSSDLVTVFAAGKYEADADAGWADGDWGGDMKFDSGDLVVAFAEGGYELGPRPAVIAVPEPASIVMLLTGLIGISIRRLNVVA